MNENVKVILITFIGASILLYSGYCCVKRPARAREIYNYSRKDYKWFGDPPNETYFRVAGVLMLAWGALLLYFGVRVCIEIISTYI